MEDLKKGPSSQSQEHTIREEHHSFDKYKRKQSDLELVSENDSDSDTIPIQPYVEYILHSTDKEFYFNKPHEIRCLGDIELSRSSLLRNPFLVFGEVQDPGLDENLWYEEPDVVYDNIGVERYKFLCQKYRIPIMRRFIVSLPTTMVDLKYCGLTTKCLRAITETLLYNDTVQVLDLTDNWVTPVGARYLGEMVAKNNTIKTLILKGIKLGVKGAEEFATGLIDNRSLVQLVLSKNNLQDMGINAIANALPALPALTSLDVSHNNLSSDSGEYLGNAFLICPRLQKIDLSWNNINAMTGTKKLMAGIRDNRKQRCTHLNMAWNNLRGVEACGPIGALLKLHASLTFLDISHNSIRGDSLKFLIDGLQQSKSLHELRMSHNPITEENLVILLTALKTSPIDNAFTILDLSGIDIEKAHVQLLHNINNKGRLVRFKRITSNWEIIGPDYRKLLLERCKFLVESRTSKKKSRIAKKQFGTWFYEVESDEPMKRTDFITHFINPIKCKKLSKDEPLLIELMSQFQNEKKKVEIAEMRDLYFQMYPNTQKPSPKTNSKDVEENAKKVMA